MKKRKTPIVASEKIEEYLTSWAKLNSVIAKLPEDIVATLLRHELANRRNTAIVLRLHQRWSALRALRERKVLKTFTETEIEKKAVPEHVEEMIKSTGAL